MSNRARGTIVFSFLHVCKLRSLICILLHFGLITTSSKTQNITIHSNKVASIYQGNPTYNYGGDNVAFIEADAGNLSRTLIEFDLSTIPAGANIISAQLSLTHTNNSDCAGEIGDGNAFTIGVRRITRDWIEGTTCYASQSGSVSWNRAGSNNWTSVGGDYASSDYGSFLGGYPDPGGTIYSVDITLLVNQWHNGTFPNYGLILLNLDDNTGFDWFNIHADEGTPNQPRLIITYSTVDPCDPLLSGNTDSDGDSVSDICDLDDDNDGISDEDECSFTLTEGITTCTPTAYDLDPLGSYATSGGLSSTVADENSLQAVVGEVGVYEMIRVSDNAPYYLAIRIISTNSNPPSDLFDFDADIINGKPLVNLEFSGTTSIPGKEQMIVDFAFYDATESVFSSATNLVEIAITISNGLGTPIADCYSIDVEDIDGGTSSSRQEAVYARYDDIVAIVTETPTSYIDFRSGDFIGIEGTVNNPNEFVKFYFTKGVNEFVLINDSDVNAGFDLDFSNSISYINPITRIISCDTDGDGVPNYLDLDSDNDGCPDAIEGGDNFSDADIENDTLIGGVDPVTGIPIIAGSGQSAGDSQDSIIHDSCVEICNDGIDNDGDNYVDCFDEDCPCYAPFICDVNSLYQTIGLTQSIPNEGIDGDFVLYRIDPISANFNFVANLTNNGLLGQINSIGYNPIDGFIYGINQAPPYTIYRINALGDIDNLGEVSGLTDQNAAGAIDKNGNYYVTGESQRLFRIDLNTLQASLIGNTGINCFDIAINPVDGLLYTWSSDDQQLASIDPSNGTTTLIGSSDPNYYIFGALYFNSQGRLIGYGNNISITGTAQETLADIDLNTGLVTTLGIGPDTRNNDGCSCSNGIEITKSSLDTICIGSTLTYTFTIYNRTGGIFNDVIFRDTLPNGLNFSSNPYNSNGSLTTIGTTINNPIADIILDNVPTGVSSFQLDIYIPNFYGGNPVISNRAYLSNLNNSNTLIKDLIQSDDPATLNLGDATETYVSQENTQCLDPCDALTTGNIDTDGDGVSDICDLDDDNDGIPDFEECQNYLNLDLLNATTLINGSTITGISSVYLLDTIKLINVGTLSDGTSLDSRIIITSVTSGVEYDPNNTMISVAPYNSSLDDHFTFSFTVLESGTNDIIPFQGQIIFRDIDSAPGRNYTEMIGFAHSPLINLGSNLQSVSYQNGGGPNAAYTHYGVNPAGYGAVTDWFDEPNTSDSNIDHWATAIFNGQSQIDISFGVTGTHGLRNFTRDLLLSEIYLLDRCDCDNDGVPNAIDLDSDNDGIYDVSEAGHMGTDNDGDGIIDGTAAVFGDNGLYNGFESATDNGILNYSVSDSESTPDGIYDICELDADGDGCYDAYEELIEDPENDGIAGTGTPTVDNQGRVNSITYAMPTNNMWQNPLYDYCAICRKATINPHVMYYRPTKN